MVGGRGAAGLLCKGGLQLRVVVAVGGKIAAEIIMLQLAVAFGGAKHGDAVMV